MLLGFIGGSGARSWYGLSAEARRQAVIENFVDYFGEKARNPVQYVENAWAEERFSRGDPVAGLGPGTLLDFGASLRRAGRAHPLGRHRDLRLLGRLHGRRRALRRTAAAEVLAELS